MANDQGNPIVENLAAWQDFATELRSDALPLEFGMRGAKMFFSVGVQSFALDYEPECDEQFNYMADMLSKAMARLYGQQSGVPIPTDVDMAQLMVGMGVLYLETYAPERLKKRDDTAADAARWRAFRARDNFRNLEASDFLDQFLEDADRLIDAAMQEQAACAARET